MASAPASGGADVSFEYRDLPRDQTGMLMSLDGPP